MPPSAVGPMCRRLIPVALLLAAPLLDAAALLHRHDVFVIERNKNRNQVQYAVHLDDACRPVGDEPLVSFWRMLEVGPDATEEVGLFERAAYGIARQERRADGVTVRLKALPERVVTVRAADEGGRCRARAFTVIAGAEARLTRVYVVADEGSLLPGVRHLDLFGLAADGRPVTERLVAR